MKSKGVQKIPRSLSPDELWMVYVIVCDRVIWMIRVMIDYATDFKLKMTKILNIDKYRKTR